MTSLLEALSGASAPDRDSYRPVFFRLALSKDRRELEELLKREPRVVVHDALHSQLTELVRSLNPSIKYSKDELDAAAVAHLKGTTPAEYGVWVYYPWSFRLVHLLDEAEFSLVRTDRNRNKITREEQAVLATKKVGVIGLSVGQSVSLTMALERSFGEIRLADFDTLELSNLNRIRSGVHEMGCSKVVNTAREIAEIDPWLKVTCYPQGITAENIDAFLTEGGKLDLLVEECDAVYIKILCRQRAKSYGIPVLMDTSDRGMVDIERFDLELERPILHGMVEHLDLALAAQAKTNEEKMPFVIPVVGLDTMSVRMKATMMELENTVTTWPQLASSVVLGGALGGHLMRRIVLGHPIPSGRWWMDPDDLIGVPEQEADKAELAYVPVPLTSEHATLDLDGMVTAAEALGRSTPTLSFTEAEAKALAQAGSHAPSGGNCQPWKFLHHKGRLLLFMDVDRARSALDPGLRYAYLGLGACLENMILHGAQLGLDLRYDFTPNSDHPQLIASLEIRTRQENPAPSDATLRLVKQIPLRCTNRKNSEVLALSAEETRALEQAITQEALGTKLTIVQDRERIDKIAALCGKAERIRFLNVTCHHDMFVREMRWNQREVESTRDGIDVDTLELSLTDRTGLRVAADPKAMSMLRFWGTGRAMEKMATKGVRASSALAIVSVPDYDIASAFCGGRATQRFWLRASELGILAHPVGAPIFMGIHGLWDRTGILSPAEHEEASAILEELKQVIGDEGSLPFFMLRLGKASAPSTLSLRRPLSEIFHTLNPTFA
jgi:molybdopterin/thiamine biosynthesis adenylyltransferase/nitroreductase